MNRKSEILSARAVEKRKQEGEKLIALVERNLDFANWGFRITYSDFTIDGTPVIYDSESCRVDFRLHHRGPAPSDDELYITYGRLHAPNTEPFMISNGKKYYCWHRSRPLPIFFLDEYSPIDIVNKVRPPVAEQFWRSEEGVILRKTYPPEFNLKLETILWERYAPRLFELFDLRRPDLWEKYRKFLKEFYDIKGRSPNIKPPLDQVC